MNTGRLDLVAVVLPQALPVAPGERRRRGFGRWAPEASLLGATRTPAPSVERVQTCR